ncbi:hypothetical protein SL1157_1694 [Ruegeria lacuscaerulensis ITI-1157]|nr:hypothetical protein SL1157_1694 [Ruegeria lacuscaerulensis ITI-1157]SHK06665.1 hypothetical protein SAMN05444404_3230 [Ruegeria lacuscaerulensis ITI-1157]
MRQKPGTKQSHGEKVVKDIRLSVVRDFGTDSGLIKERVWLIWLF